ncbi:unnamed protein product, partial [Mesorhabditis spiculigera]
MSHRDDDSQANATQRSDGGEEYDRDIEEALGNYEDAPDEEEDEGEDLFGDNMERFYREQPELDRLSESGLDDDSDVDEYDPEARRRAEAEMNRRDQIDDPDRLLFGPMETDGRKDRRRRRRRGLDEDEEMPADEDENIPIDIIENMRGRSMKDHVNDEAVGREIERRFKKFIRTFREEGSSRIKYMDAVQKICSENKDSITVNYDDLSVDCGEQNIAYFLPEAPLQVLARLNKAISDIVFEVFPFYRNICPEIKVRVSDLPVQENIRMLRQLHLNMLVRTSGVVTQTTGILPQLSLVKYDCVVCKYLLGPFYQQQNEEVKPTICPSCQSKGPFELNVENTIYQNLQRIVIQESPNKVAAGRLPRSKDVILLGDLCDSCKPGDEIDVTGIYTNNYDGALNFKQGFPVFTTFIQANHIYNRDKVEENPLSEDELKMIRERSNDPQIAGHQFASIAPSIHGHQDVKKAIALALFRGESKNPGEKHRIRGDMNVLRCSDPGCAKSQCLRYAGHIAPRAVLTTGQGTSAVGRTAYVQRHPVTHEWTLEAGAMVLADKGVCLIDEFDKMNDQVRTSIHGAMEQQSISVSKVGIVTSLQVVDDRPRVMRIRRIWPLVTLCCFILLVPGAQAEPGDATAAWANFCLNMCWLVAGGLMGVAAAHHFPSAERLIVHSGIVAFFAGFFYFWVLLYRAFCDGFTGMSIEFPWAAVACLASAGILYYLMLEKWRNEDYVKRRMRSYKDQVRAELAEERFIGKRCYYCWTRIIWLQEKLKCRQCPRQAHPRCIPGRHVVDRVRQQWRASFDAPLGWDELCADFYMAFQALRAYDDGLLISACAKVPVNVYSKQCLKWINTETGAVVKKVPCEGKNDSEIFFPRKIQRHNDDIIVVDKTGRFLKFDKSGEYKGLAAQIDAYLANGFCIKDDGAAIVCSGIVQDDAKRSVCDDWVEVIPLDGSSWKDRRRE